MSNELMENLDSLVKHASLLAHIVEKKAKEQPGGSEKTASAGFKDAVEKVAAVLCDYGQLSHEKKAMFVESVTNDPELLADTVRDLSSANTKQAAAILELKQNSQEKTASHSVGEPAGTPKRVVKTAEEIWHEQFAGMGR